MKANLSYSLAFAATLLAQQAGAAITITATETAAGLVWSFVGTAVTTLGPATQSVGLRHNADGNNTSIHFDGRRSPRSSILRFVETAPQLTPVPYRELRLGSSTIFLDPDSFNGSTLLGTSSSLFTAGSGENLEQFNFDLSSSETRIDIITYAAIAQVDRTYTMIGIGFADLNLKSSVEYDTIYQLGDGHTLTFVTVPEPSATLLGLTGICLLLRRRRIP